MRNPLPDLRPVWIPLGWFVAAALTSLFILAMAALGLVGDSPDEGYWTPLALLLGFGLAGFVMGTRTGAAPVLHAVGIGLFSLLVWVGVNIFLGEPTDQTAWTGLGTDAAAALLLLQTISCAVGARLGVRWVRPE
jgi:hypothetical protein